MKQPSDGSIYAAVSKSATPIPERVELQVMLERAAAALDVHTPGPWRANNSCIEGPQMGLRIATVDWPKIGCASKTEIEAKANARLIAAAPELLAALEAVRLRCDDTSYPNIECETFNQITRAIRLAKTGNAP